VSINHALQQLFFDHSGYSVSRYFDESPPDIHLIVQVPPSGIDEVDHISGTTKKRKLEVEENQRSTDDLRDVRLAREALPPSSAAKIPAFRDHQQKNPSLVQ